MSVILPDILPDEEYVVRKKPKTELQSLRDQRDEIQIQLDNASVPNNDELKELGKLYHSYYRLKDELDRIKALIKELNG